MVSPIILMSQEKYARDLLIRFGMSGCNTEDTPMNSNERLQLDDNADKADAEMYRRLVGSLIYLTHTRPDIAYSVSLVSRYMQNPSKNHFGAAKRVLRYVAGTLKFGLWFKRANEGQGVILSGFSDSDWAGCMDDRKSTSASIFTIGSAAITWSTKKQQTVALSSTEAEYIASTAATCQAIWLRRILKDLMLSQEEATTIYCDNRSTICLSKNPIMHSRSKHIELKYHFVREMVTQKQVKLEFCGTQEQAADILTKALSKEKFGYFRKMIGMQEFELSGGIKK